HFTTPLLSQLHYPPSPKPYTLSLHDALPIFTHRAANPCLSIFERLRNPAEHQHLCADLDGELDDIARSSAFEDVDRFPHFDGIAARSAEHLIHIGDQRAHLAVHALADADHRLRQAARVIERLHERARSDFDVEDQ